MAFSLFPIFPAESTILRNRMGGGGELLWDGQKSSSVNSFHLTQPCKDTQWTKDEGKGKETLQEAGLDTCQIEQPACTFPFAI